MLSTTAQQGLLRKEPEEGLHFQEFQGFLQELQPLIPLRAPGIWVGFLQHHMHSPGAALYFGPLSLCVVLGAAECPGAERGGFWGLTLESVPEFGVAVGVTIPLNRMLQNSEGY